MTFDEVVDIVTERSSAHYVVATIWHPKPNTELVPTSHGTARVLVGDEAKYQLSTGEVVKL